LSVVSGVAVADAAVDAGKGDEELLPTVTGLIAVITVAAA
jgi:hypothetical protein